MVQGGTDTITIAELQVTDVDNAPAQLTYTVTVGSVNGQLELVGNPGVPISSFTQAQINAGQVVYVHNGSATVSDGFTFTVSDGAGGNIGATSFGISVTGVVNSPPVLATNAGSFVTQGLVDVITSAELRVADANHPPAQLVYTVTTSPLNGQLELTTAPGVAITSFTQADIDAGRLVFVHNGAVSTSDRFTFTVSDGAGGTIGATTFAFTVSPFAPPPPPAPLPSPDPGPGPGPGPGPNLSGLPSAGGVLSLPFVLPPPDRAWISGGDRGDAAGGTGPRVGTSSLMPTKSVEGAVKHPPLNIVPEGQTVTSGTSLSLAGISVIDEDGDLATVQLTVTNGTLTVTLAGEAAIAEGANGTSTMTLSGTEDEINATLATLTYRSASNYSGTDTLTLLSADVKGSMDSTTVTITVSAASEGASSLDSLAAQLNRWADELERKMQEREEQAHLIARIAAFSGVALSAGFVAWLLRSGSLLASFLVSLPAWRHFDPLPVLGLGRRRRKERDQEMREDHEQENREFQGLDRVLKSKTQTTKQQDASRGRHPEA